MHQTCRGPALVIRLVEVADDVELPEREPSAGDGRPDPRRLDSLGLLEERVGAESRPAAPARVARNQQRIHVLRELFGVLEEVPRPGIVSHRAGAAFPQLHLLAQPPPEKHGHFRRPDPPGGRRSGGEDARNWCCRSPPPSRPRSTRPSAAAGRPSAVTVPCTSVPTLSARGDTVRRHGRAPVRRDPIAGDDVQRGHPAELVDQLLGDAIGQIPQRVQLRPRGGSRARRCAAVEPARPGGPARSAAAGGAPTTRRRATPRRRGQPTTQWRPDLSTAPGAGPPPRAQPAHRRTRPWTTVGPRLRERGRARLHPSRGRPVQALDLGHLLERMAGDHGRRGSALNGGHQRASHRGRNRGCTHRSGHPSQSPRAPARDSCTAQCLPGARRERAAPPTRPRARCRNRRPACGRSGAAGSRASRRSG